MDSTKFISTILMPFCFIFTLTCGGDGSDTHISDTHISDIPITCSITGTWEFTETQTGGSCNLSSDNEPEKVRILSVEDGYTWSILLDDGTEIPCNGKIIKSSCGGTVTCQKTLNGKEGTDGLPWQGTFKTTYEITFTGDTASGTVDGEWNASDNSPLPSCTFIGNTNGVRK